MPRIAVIDDEPDLLGLIQDVFDQRGWETVLYLNGATALAEIVHDPPDVIILDLWLGSGISGWDVLEDLQAHHLTRDIPVIIWSAVDPELRDRGDWLREQDIAVLPKPFEIDDLYAVVDDVLTARMGTWNQRA
jgi:DNA-binding response OmpR family regulator